MPAPIEDGIQIAEEKIWSSDTGRTSSGKLVGTLIAVKRTVTITWPSLSAAQAKAIRQAVTEGSAFQTMTWTDIDGTTASMTCYFSSPQYTIHRLRNGVPVITGCTVQGIEQ